MARQLETIFSDFVATVWPCHLILDNCYESGVIYSTLASLKREWVALHSLSHFLRLNVTRAGKPALTRQRMAAHQERAGAAQQKEPGPDGLVELSFTTQSSDL